MVAMVFCLPFVLRPGLAGAFSAPKKILIEAVVIVVGVLVASQGRLRWPGLPRGFNASVCALLAALTMSSIVGSFVSLKVLLLPLSVMGWFVLLLVVRPRTIYLAMAIAFSSAGVAVIALLQYVGLDPFSLLGWTVSQYGSPRMRVVGTLGNPNFVASLIVSAMPLVWILGDLLRRQTLFLSLLALEVMAVFATGSRAGILAIIATFCWLGAVGRLAPRTIVAATVLLLLLSSFMPSRALLSTIEGRLYIWRVTVPHLIERPLLGWGPGSFQPKYIEWETLYWQGGHGSERDREFAQLQAHAHNEYLEMMVDQGLVGTLGMLAILASFLAFAGRHAKKIGGELVAGASAGVVALAATALVDFPLHRPTELFLFWTLIAITFLAGWAPNQTTGRRLQAHTQMSSNK